MCLKCTRLPTRCNHSWLLKASGLILQSVSGEALLLVHCRLKEKLLHLRLRLRYHRSEGFLTILEILPLRSIWDRFNIALGRTEHLFFSHRHPNLLAHL